MRGGFGGVDDGYVIGYAMVMATAGVVVGVGIGLTE